MPFWPRASPPWDQALYCALDLETSGLDVARDAIVALAVLPIRGGAIRYGERLASLVRPPDLAVLSHDGIAAHQILPADLAAAPPAAGLLPMLDERLRGAVLVLHHAPLDLAFLRRAYREAARPWPRPLYLDTVELLHRLDRRRLLLAPHPAPLPANLAAARAALDLPAYPNHDALADATATAELFLLLRARLDARRLRDLRPRRAS
jgi:DNA polymerase III subunit epsilon